MEESTGLHEGSALGAPDAPVDQTAEAPLPLIDVDFATECFFITPIGKRDSAERKRADGMLEAVVEPASAAVGLQAIRADKIEEGGHVTLQVLEHCANAKASIADLTGRNLNVYYEVGIRHALRQPLVLVADEAERGNLPFDLLQQRTIFYTNDMAGAAACQRAVTEQLRRALGGHVDSPVQAAVNLRAFQQGNAVEQTLADLVTKVEQLGVRVARPRPTIPPGVARDLLIGIGRMVEHAHSQDNDKLLRILEDIAPALMYVSDTSSFRARGRKLHPDADFGLFVLQKLLESRRDYRRDRLSPVDDGKELEASPDEEDQETLSNEGDAEDDDSTVSP